MSITKTFQPHPDLLATPLSEREEWVGYLENYAQAVGALNNNYGSLCCLAALVAGRGCSTKAPANELCEYNDERMTLGGRFLYHRAEGEVEYFKAAKYRGVSFTFTDLNDRQGLTFPEISQLLLGNSVTKEYADGELS